MHVTEMAQATALLTGAIETYNTQPCPENKQEGARHVAQSIQCWPRTHKGLGVIP